MRKTSSLSQSTSSKLREEITKISSYLFSERYRSVLLLQAIIIKGQQKMGNFKIYENLTISILSSTCSQLIIICCTLFIPTPPYNIVYGMGMEGVKEPFLVTLNNSMTNSKSGQGHNAQKGLLVQHLYCQS